MNALTADLLAALIPRCVIDDVAILAFVLCTDQSTYSAKGEVRRVLAEALNNAGDLRLELPRAGLEALTFDTCLTLASSTLEQPLHNVP
jgi:hypothetical protein